MKWIWSCLQKWCLHVVTGEAIEGIWLRSVHNCWKLLPCVFFLTTNSAMEKCFLRVFLVLLVSCKNGWHETQSSQWFHTISLIDSFWCVKSFSNSLTKFRKKKKTVCKFFSKWNLQMHVGRKCIHTFVRPQGHMHCILVRLWTRRDTLHL